MVLAQIEFLVEEARHRVELETQPSLPGYVVTVDGQTRFHIPAKGLGFKKRFALFDGFCTVSSITLGRFFTRYRIKMEQTRR